MTIDKTYTIQKLTSKLKYKEVLLNNQWTLNLPYSTCIDKDCKIIHKPSNLFIECINGDIQIFPTYCKKDKISIGGFSIDLLIKEITDEDELKAYESLAKYHYKGKALFGRTSILVAVNTTPYLPRVIGYIELATPFYVNKPRSEILNAPFNLNGINWNAWDKETTKKYINTIVRIARCVVYPEFRGIGLGQMLIEHAEIFARERWQISKLKPLFLEISADMLRYIPFVEKVGMHFIGETEGNLNRIHKDLSYLLTNFKRIQAKEIVSNHQMGIVEQQKSRLRKAMKLASESGLSIEEFITKLEKLNKERRLKDFTFFNGLVSLPKPTYIKGLDETSDAFIVHQLGKIPFSEVESFYEKVKLQKLSSPIVLEHLNIGYLSSIRRTKKTQAIYNAFGISPNEIEYQIINDLSLTINPGEIVLIMGSSGAGKTTLLNFLSKNLTDKTEVKIKGDYIFPDNYQPGEFKDIKSQKALVEYFGDEDLLYALQLMGNVGLSDAYVYVKRFDELSKGQQYRALFAKLIHSRSNTLIVDEFCSNLDPITANVLAHRIYKLCKRLGITLIAGAAHFEAFILSLNPDKVVRLSTAWDYEVIDGPIFTKSFSEKNHPLNIPILKLKSEYFDLILQGKKSTTIRRFNSSFNLGCSLLESEKNILPVYIKNIENKLFKELNSDDALRDGFSTLEDLKVTLLKIYNNLTDDSRITILHFKTIDFK
jgi:ABC-type ATPase with predicted acetyltransferase domain